MPTMLEVRSAMRMDSDEPLIDGVPVHDAAPGMLISEVCCLDFLPLITTTYGLVDVLHKHAVHLD